jgi:hypothetical protein
MLSDCQTVTRYSRWVTVYNQKFDNDGYDHHHHHFSPKKIQTARRVTIISSPQTLNRIL